LYEVEVGLEREEREQHRFFGVSSVNSGRRLQHEQQIKNRMYVLGVALAVNERAADKETEPPCDTSVQQEAPMVTFTKGSIPLFPFFQRPLVTH